jgi:tetratricopeptide (TPR) repeat protein
MTIKKYGVVVVLALSVLQTQAQKTIAYTDKEALYKTGLDLFDKKQFTAAEKSFIDYTGIASAPSLLKVDAEYYAAACAIELFHKDGEMRMRDFITHHPESNKINSAYFYLGKSSFRKKKYDESIRSFEKVDIYTISKDDLAELYFKRGYSYLEEKNFEKAKTDLYEIKDFDNKYIFPALYYYSHISYNEKNYETALEGFNKLVGNETFGSVVPYYITQIYFTQGKFDKVVKSAPELLNDSNHVQRTAEINRMIGESYYNLKDYKNALTFLKKTEMGSGNAPGNYALGYCYYKLGDYDNAIAHFEKATETEDSLAQSAWYHIADSYVQSKNKTKARNAYYKAYKLTFDKKIVEDALFSYSKLCYELDFSPFAEAVKSFTKYIKDYPGTKRKDEAQQFLINVYSTTKNYNAAIASIEVLDSHDPVMKAMYEKLVYFKGVESFNNGDLDNAAKQFNKAMSIDGEKTVNALSKYLLGEISYQRKDYTTAIETWKAFQLMQNAAALKEYELSNYNIGYAYFQRKEKGDYNEANIAFRKYLLKKDNADLMKVADANVRAADCYFMTGTSTNGYFAQASDMYEVALLMNKVDVDYSYYQKAMCDGLLKNYQEKIVHLKYIETNFPKSNYLSAALFEIGDTYAKDLNDGDNALLYYEKIVNNYPTSTFADPSLSGIGLIYYNRKQDDKAFEAFDKIVQKDPKSDNAREVMPMIKKIFEAKGNIDEMERYFTSIGNPLSVNQIELALYDAAKDAYYNQKNCDVATPKLESYINKFPDGKYTNEVQFCYGECTYSKGQYDKALPAYKYVISRSRSIYSEVAYSKATYLLFKDKKYQEALPLYQQMQEISETPANKLLAKLGSMRCAFYLDQFDVALEETKKVMESDKLTAQQTSEAKYIKARSLFETQRYDDALNEFKAIAKTAKSATGAEAIYYTAKIYFVKQDYKETEKTVNSLISYAYTNDDWNTKGMLLMADNYTARGDDKDAEVILQSIIDSKPKAEYAEEAQKKIGIIKEKQKARLQAEQLVSPEMKVEFKSAANDKSLFDKPVEPAKETVPVESSTNTNVKPQEEHE